MKCVQFITPTVLDLDFLRIIGASVKTSDSAIGYFGTGLKYSIATAIRNGCRVEIKICQDNKLETYKIELQKGELRGREFNFIAINGERLAYTTELGKNWELWEAYRELHSNTLDEGGIIGDSVSVSDVKSDDWTAIIIYSDNFHQEYVKRDAIFINKEKMGLPIYEDEHLIVYDKPTTYGFYRGVRVCSFEVQSTMTFNILKGVQLTEDRTVKSMWDFNYELMRITATQDAKTAFKVFGNPLFTKVSLYGTHMSDEFIECAVENKNASAIALRFMECAIQSKRITYDYAPHVLSSYEKAMLEKAWKIVAVIGYQPHKVSFVKSIPGGAYGTYTRTTGEIRIAQKTFEMGDLFLAATLAEEIIHKEEGHDDCDRNMQNFLFQKIAYLAAVIHGDKVAPMEVRKKYEEEFAKDLDDCPF